jgi:eukaryotic-like serine/threonine-protein kinase
MSESPAVPASRARDAGTRLGPAQQLEDLWRHGDRPDVQEFLRRQENLTPEQIVAVLCVDQWHRWQLGERVPAETYLQRHPALVSAWADSFELISGEFHIRRELGENPSVEEYRDRFPQFAAKLEKIESVVRSWPPPTTNLNTPAGRISTADAVAADRKVTSEWPQVPGYEVIGKLGQGGMGHVYKARQERLNRLVALKIIRKESLSQDPRAVRRFQREAQAAAQLSHPNIIVIYDFNHSGNTYYIAMEYVEGVDLHQLVQDYGPLPMDLATDFILQTACGLQHAHDAGMVHRDIKPSNLMVALPKSEGGSIKVPSGEAGLRTFMQKSLVKILDMGTALLVHGVDADSAKYTQQGALMGTPDYLAPEQAVDSHAVDIRADLYSLGCTYYYLLTGKPPFGQYPLMKKLMMHQTMLPKPVREFRPEVAAHIEMVVHRLLAKRPEDRYQVPAELIEALTTHQLHTKPVTLAGSALETRRGTGRSTPDLETPIPASKFPPGQSQADRAAEAETHRQWGTQSPETPAGSESPRTIAVLKGDPSWVVAVAFSPTRNALASGSLLGNIRLWAFSKGKPSNNAAIRAKSQELHSLAYAPNNRTLASGSGALDGVISIWDLAQTAPQMKLTLEGHRAPVDALAFSADSTLLASGGADKTVRLWDLSEAAPCERAIFKGHDDTVKSVAFSPDGKTLASGSLDGTVRLWRRGGMWSRDMVALISADSSPVHAVAYAPDGHTVAFGGLDQMVQVWDVTADNPKRKAVLQGHTGVVRLVLFPPDRKTLASVCDGGRIILWDLESAAKLRDWQLPRLTICSVAFTYDARYLAAGVSDGSVHVFRLYPKADEAAG